MRYPIPGDLAPDAHNKVLKSCARRQDAQATHKTKKRLPPGTGRYAQPGCVVRAARHGSTPRMPWAIHKASDPTESVHN